MNITKQQLKKLIKEEIQNALEEVEPIPREQVPAVNMLPFELDEKLTPKERTRKNKLEKELEALEHK